MSEESRSFEVLTIDLADIDRHGDLLQDMFDRRSLGAILRRVFEPEQMQVLADRLTAGIEGMPRATAPTFKGGLYGQPLVLASEDLRGYLDDAEKFEERVAPMFEQSGGLGSRIESLLGQLSSGLPVEIARDDDGRAYLSASVRVLVEGDSLPIHYENGTTKYESMTRLLHHVDTETIMSFYVPVQLPRDGGILEVFTTDCTGPGDRAIERLGGPERAREVLTARGCVEVLPGVGDMLVFDGGRHYHHVTEIRGGARWTLGGFFAFTKGHDRILYWS